MLSADHRLRDSDAFRRTVRAGRRAGASAIVVHLDHAVAGGVPAPTRAGLVVSRAVGNAVVRNQVKRRLRHLVKPRLADLPSGSTLVIRASPAASGLPSAELAAQLDRCLERVRAAAPASPTGASS